MRLTGDNKSSKTIWHLKDLEDNEYSILTGDQKEIIVMPADECLLYPYEEGENWQEENQFRWMFIREKGQNDKITVSIHNV